MSRGEARSRRPVFPIDLGTIAAGDPNVPVVNRDPEAFFRGTYLTADLQKLREEALASLGGKSHTFASLLPAARKREALDGVPEAKDFAKPKNVAVAVFDEEKFDARNGEVEPSARCGVGSPGKLTRCERSLSWRTTTMIASPPAAR